MKSSGRNISQALEGLTSQAQRSGGSRSQSPDARAIAAADSMGGDLVDNLQRLGAGNAFDSKIRDVQKQGERSGYTPEMRQMINQMRQFQTGAAQDARSMGKISFTPGGGGGYGGGGGSRGMAGDPLTMLAQLLGQYKGARDYNMNTTAVGADNNLRRSLMMEQGATTENLEQVFEEMMKQKRLETGLLQDRMKQSQQASKQSHGTGQIGVQGISPQRPSRPFGNDMRSPGGNWNSRSSGSGSSSWSSSGSGRGVHDSAIAAALRALGKF